LYSRDIRFEHIITQILNQLEAFCDGLFKDEHKNELLFNNDRIAIEIQNNNQTVLFESEEIHFELNKNSHLKDQIKKINRLINSKKEKAILDEEILTLRIEDNPSTLFLYLIELPPKIFEYIIGKIRYKEFGIPKQIMKMDLD